MLLIWLFALSAGVANACLLEDTAPHGKPPTVGTKSGHRPGSAGGFRLAVHEEQAGHGDQPSPKAPCLKVCDDGPQSLVKQVSPPGFDAPVLAVAFARLWSPLTSVLDDGAWRAAWARVPPAAPSPRVRFCRLAL
jgi:hypothetical protein